MGEIKAVQKGYTLAVKSWENDGDNYNTKSMTVETFAEAKVIRDMCIKLFQSESRGKGGVGNSMGENGKCDVIEYFTENEEAFKVLPSYWELKDRMAISPYQENEIFEYFTDWAYELMSGSEYYDFRVCESCVVTYSPIDIFVEEVVFS